MDIIIKTYYCEGLNVSLEKFKIISSDLEKLLNVEPDEYTKRQAQERNLSIDQKEIMIHQDDPICYNVEFYHNQKEGEKKKCYLGQIDYKSPVILSQQII